MRPGDRIRANEQGRQDVRMDRMQPWRESNSQEPCINILSIPFILSKEGERQDVRMDRMR